MSDVLVVIDVVVEVKQAQSTGYFRIKFGVRRTGVSTDGACAVRALPLYLSAIGSTTLPAAT